MSGPTTAILVADPIAVLLSAAGIRAAMAIEDGYRQSAELAAQHKSEHSATIHQQQQATLAGQQARQQLLELAETEFAQLLMLSERLGVADRIQSGKPAQTDSDNAATLLALQTYNAEIKAILRNQAAAQDMTNDGSDEPDFKSASSAEPVTEKLQRQLSRIQHLGALPEPIQALANQLASNLPPQREQLLMLELKRQIQLYLEQVQQVQVQEASALILRHTLKELGYQVQEFSDTLFVDGGVVHFRKQGWGNHMVRMRINEKTHSANFNVIRAVADASNEISVLDHLAEDRWCAEFPTLLNAMAAQGLNLNVTRCLAAGEVPVQLVPGTQLPTFTDTDSEHRADPLIARTLT